MNFWLLAIQGITSRGYFNTSSTANLSKDSTIFVNLQMETLTTEEECVAHSAAVNCLKIGRKSSRVLVTGGEDHQVNLWAIFTFDASEVLVAAGAASQHNRSRKRKELDKKVRHKL
ncbi:unnamed protein product [Brassica oleracea var. botrytis]